jgi:stage 0 sporulation protein B (sporulation initiation phosphotransferase)
MEKKWTVVDALRHSRHDWLNRLQLVKAHLSLGGIERVQELIEEFVGEAQQESRLMNLKLPLFTELLLTYNWECPPFYLEYEVLGEVHTLTYLDEPLTQWARDFFRLLQEAVDVHVENHLCVTVEQEEQDVRFFFDFRGRLTDIDSIENRLITYKESCFSISYSIQNEEISIEIQTKEQ